MNNEQVNHDYVMSDTSGVPHQPINPSYVHQNSSSNPSNEKSNSVPIVIPEDEVIIVSDGITMNPSTDSVQLTPTQRIIQGIMGIVFTALFFVLFVTFFTFFFALFVVVAFIIGILILIHLYTHRADYVVTENGNTTTWKYKGDGSKNSHRTNSAVLVESFDDEIKDATGPTGVPV